MVITMRVDAGRRRRTTGVAASAIGLAVLVTLPAAASAAVQAGRTVVVTPQASSVTLEGYPTAAAVTAEAVRGGVIVARSTGTVDGAGDLALSLASCASGVTSIQAGDTIRLRGTGINDSLIAQRLSVTPPPVSSPGTGPANGTLVIDGIAETPAGLQLPPAALSLRIGAGNPNGRLDAPPTGAATYQGTISYPDASTVWEASFSGLTPGQVTTAVNNIAAGVVEVAAALGVNDNEVTAGIAGAGAPLAGACPSQALNTIASATPNALTAANVPPGQVVVSGTVEPDAGSATVTLASSSVGTITLPVGPIVAGQYSVTFPDTSALGPGTITARLAVQIDGASIAGANELTITKDVVLPATPTFSPPLPATPPMGPLNVTVTSPGGLIRYTLDGSAPTTTTGTLAPSPAVIALNATTQIRALAADVAGNSNNAVASASYTVIAPGVNGITSIAPGPLTTAWLSSGTGVTLTGQFQVDATNVQMTLRNGAQSTAAFPAVPLGVPSGGVQTWAVTIPSAAVAAIDDGTLLASSSFTLASSPIAATGAGFRTLTVEKDTAAPVGAITATPPPGLYLTGATLPVILHGPAEAGVTVRYTTDGSQPSAASPTTLPIVLSTSTTIRAVAVDSVGNVGAPTSLVYDIVPTAANRVTGTTPSVVNLANAGQAFSVTGVVQSNATAVTVTIDDQSLATAPITVAATLGAAGGGSRSFQVTIPAGVGALVDGTLTARADVLLPGGNSTAAANLTLDKDTVAPAPPTATPAAGTFPGPQRVSLGTEAGASIRLTTDGSNPTPSSILYVGPILVDRALAIHAIAIDAAGNRSGVATHEYAITQPAPPAPLAQIAGVAAKVSATTLTTRGITVTGIGAQGTRIVRVRMFRLVPVAKTNRRTPVLLFTRFQPAAPGAFRITLAPAKLRQLLRPGSYRIELTPGTSRTTLGRPTSRTFRVVAR